jgi:hypothetical protein
MDNVLSYLEIINFTIKIFLGRYKIYQFILKEQSAPNHSGTWTSDGPKPTGQEESQTQPYDISSSQVIVS